MTQTQTRKETKNSKNRQSQRINRLIENDYVTNLNGDCPPAIETDPIQLTHKLCR